MAGRKVLIASAAGLWLYWQVDISMGVGCYLRRIDQDGQNAVDKCPVREIITLVVVHDCAKGVVGIPDVDRCGVAALDADRWGSGRSGNPPLDRSAARP